MKESEKLEKMFEEAVEIYDNQDTDRAEQAAQTFRSLLGQGFDAAYTPLGLCYLDGFGVEKDEARGFEYIQKGHENGFYYASNMLGCCYYDGLGVEPDHAKAYGLFRYAAEHDQAGAVHILEQVEFPDEDKRPFEEETDQEPLLTDDEVIDAKLVAETGGAVSQYKLAKYYEAIARKSGEREDIENALRYAEMAFDNGWGLATSLLSRLVILYCVSEMRTLSRLTVDQIPLIDGHEPNAVMVNPGGFAAEPIYVEDFSSYKGLGQPLNCKRINIVSTMGMKQLSKIFSTTLVGYVDEEGQAKELLNNSTMSAISGYDYLAGRCVICGFDNDYAPLDGKTAMALAWWLDRFDWLDENMFAWGTALS